MTTTPRIAVVPLADQHDRALFDCGNAPLNDYLRRFARQNDDAGVSRTFVTTGLDDPRRVLGYFSLAATSVAFHTLPPERRKKLPRYPVPAALLARLAVDRALQGQGLGSVLVADAFKRTLGAADAIGIRFLLIHAKDERAKRFYIRFNAVALRDDPLRLIVDLRVVRATTKL